MHQGIIMASEEGVRTRRQKALESSVTLGDEAGSLGAAGGVEAEQDRSDRESPTDEQITVTSAMTSKTTSVSSTSHPAMSVIRNWELQHPYSKTSVGASPKPNQGGDGTGLFPDPVMRPQAAPPLWSFSDRGLVGRQSRSTGPPSAGAFSSGQESATTSQGVLPPRGATWSLGQDRQPGEHSYRIRRDPEVHAISVRSNIRGSRPLESRSFKLHLPSFNGKGKWQTFVRQFESITYGWTEADKLHHLMVCLSDDAADYVFELDQTILDNYELLIEELHKRFHVKETRLSYSKQFYSRHLNKGEQIIEFAAELKRLIRKAYPVGLNGSVMEEMLMKQFFDGLDDEDVRYYVEYLKQPQTLDEAVDLLHEYDTCRGIKRDTALKRSVRNVRSMNYDIETVNAIDSTGRGYNPPSQASQLYQPRGSNGASQIFQQQPRMSEVAPGHANQSMQAYRNISSALASAPGAGMNQLTQAIQNLTSMFSQFLKTSTTEGQIFSNRKGGCFQCGDTTHYVKDCPNKKVQTVRMIGTEDEIQDEVRKNDMSEN